MHICVNRPQSVNLTQICPELLSTVLIESGGLWNPLVYILNIFVQDETGKYLDALNVQLSPTIPTWELYIWSSRTFIWPLYHISTKISPVLADIYTCIYVYIRSQTGFGSHGPFWVTLHPLCQNDQVSMHLGPILNREIQPSSLQDIKHILDKYAFKGPFILGTMGPRVACSTNF